MTQEDKMLLIKDLSARLPYAVTVEHTSGFKGTLHDLTAVHLYDGDNIKDIDCGIHFFGDEDWFSIEYFKPYLFPLSSMTEKQKIELTCIIDSDYAQIDWYNKNHIDYRGLITKGLAINATGKNIY